MKMKEHLIRRTLYGTAPLLIWAAHFTLCYLLVAGECSPAFLRQDAPSVWFMVAATLLALGACGTLLWRARQMPRTLIDWAHAGSAVLALAGIAWTAVPLLLLDGCG